jgi:hypothetical protein
MRQDAPYSSNGKAADWMWMVPAGGRFSWEVDQYVYPDYFPDGVPVFKKLGENHITGYHELEYIPFTYLGVQKSPFEVLYLEDPVTGQPYEHVARYGFGNDAFRIGGKTLMDPWSNPNNQKKNQSTTNIGVKVNSISGSTVYIDIYRDYNEFNITRNATLYPGTWNISQNVTVSSGVTFTIQPGAVLNFTNGAALTVNGTLTATGTSSNPITCNFTGGGGITITGSTSSGSNLSFLNINSGAGVTFSNSSSATLQNSTITGTTQGVYIIIHRLL